MVLGNNQDYLVSLFTMHHNMVVLHQCTGNALLIFFFKHKRSCIKAQIGQIRACQIKKVPASLVCNIHQMVGEQFVGVPSEAEMHSDRIVFW